MVRLQGVNSDFDSMQQKVFDDFQASNVDFEIKVLYKIKTLFIERQSADSSDTMSQIPELFVHINRLVKTQANKGSTMNTITKLIGMSNKENTCSLCQQELDLSQLVKMNKNFPVEAKSANIEARIRAQRNNLQASLESLVVSQCQCGQLDYAIQLIDE